MERIIDFTQVAGQVAKAGKTDHTSLDFVRTFSVKTSGAVHLMGKTVALPTRLQSGLSA